MAWAHGALELSAKTDLDNLASQRAFEKAGFQLLSEDEQRFYHLARPH